MAGRATRWPGTSTVALGLMTVVAAVGWYLALDRPRLGETTPPAKSVESVADARIAPAGADARTGPAVADILSAYDACTARAFPGTIDEARVQAQRVIRACSAALQSGTLTPAEIADARLSRGSARMIMGDQSLASSDYLNALKHYESTIDPMNPEALALYRSGAAFDDAGLTDDALQKYGEAVRSDPTLALAHYNRAVPMATRRRAYLRAIADLDRVLHLVPNSVEALVLRGDAYSQLGDVGHAVADLNRAIQLDPANPRAYVTRGMISERRGQDALALEDFDKALQIAPEDVAALRSRGVLQARAGHLDLALRDFDLLVKLVPRDAMTFYNRGYVYFAKRQYNLAEVDYGTAISLEPGLGAAYLNRCLTLTIQGRELVKAMADCDDALKLMPASAVARQTRGFIYLKLGDPAIAIHEYEQALKRDPNQPLALYGLGLAKIKMGRRVDGETDQAAALVLDPAVDAEFSTYGVN